MRALLDQFTWLPLFAVYLAGTIHRICEITSNKQAMSCAAWPVLLLSLLLWSECQPPNEDPDPQQNLKVVEHSVADA